MTTERDAELSALLDGALAASEESALRAELARDPVLVARLAELAQVDAALRALPARPVPADLHARLRAKLAAEAQPRSLQGAMRGGAPARPSRRRAWLAGASAAVAAAAAALLVVLAGPSGQRAVDPGGTAPLATTTEQAASRTGSGSALAASGSAASAATEQRNAIAPSPEPAPATAAPGSPDSLRVANATEPAPELPTVVALGDEPEANTAGESARATDPSALALAANPGASPTPSALGSAASPSPAPLVAVAPAAELLIEMSDSEAAALGELEADDASIVAVLDFLGELDAIEAEAS